MNAGTMFRLLLVVTLLTGCSQSPQEALLRMSFPQDKTRTVADVFEKYPYFKNGHWRDYRDEHNRNIVEYQADIDLERARNIAGANSGQGQKITAAAITAKFVLLKDKSGFETASITFAKRSSVSGNDVSSGGHANTPLDRASASDPRLIDGVASKSKAYRDSYDEMSAQILQRDLEAIISGQLLFAISQALNAEKLATEAAGPGDIAVPTVRSI